MIDQKIVSIIPRLINSLIDKGQDYHDCDVDLSLLAQGTYNKNYLLTVGTELYVVRVNIEQQSGEPEQLKREYEILKYLSSKLNVPAPVFLDTDTNTFENGLLLLRYIPGYQPEPSIGIAKQIARVLAKLHNISLPKLETNSRFCSYSITSTLELCKSLYGRLHNRLNNKTTLRLYGKMLSIAVSVVKKLGQTELESLSIIHGDPVPSNFLVRTYNHEIAMIDWETYAICNWTYDLWAVLSPAYNRWSWSRAFTSKEKALLVGEYCQNRGIDQKVAYHLLKHVDPLYSLRYSLWCLHKHLDYIEGRISKELLEDGGEKNFQKMLSTSRIALEHASISCRKFSNEV